MFAIALGLTPLETLTIAISGTIFIAAFTWVSIKGDLRKLANELIDENTLTFVALHELAHIMSKTIGHNTEFWNNFKFLLEHAVKIGIYDPIDYKKKPKKYCGMTISDNPYYDL